MALVGSNDPWYLQSVSNLDISNCGLRSEITWVVKKRTIICIVGLNLGKLSTTRNLL